jgi:hypothetical protein
MLPQPAIEHHRPDRFRDASKKAHRQLSRAQTFSRTHSSGGVAITADRTPAIAW